MRILAWNINGIRTLPQYHPWNTFKTCEEILDELGADIICFQEMKSSRAILPRDVAVPSKYSSFFSFPLAKGGYSGVAVYAKLSVANPLKAEEGLSGKLQPKPPLMSEERVSPTYPSVDDIEAYPDEEGNFPPSFDALDAEGRGLIVDFGLFVLINVYCPNETSDARLSFKMNYHLMLQERVRRLVEEEHREVIVLGDVNVCATPLDHCDGHLPSNASAFWEHPARAWFHRWLMPRGPMIDVVRSFWPERGGMYTCWNMRIQARETNYGTRVDYILATPGLMKWIKHGDIQPSLKGSDHCPIYIDLHEELTLDSGETVRLRSAMQQDYGHQPPPRIAAANWDEFSGKQKLLSSFFSKKSEVKSLTEKSPTPSQAIPPSQEPVSPQSEAGRFESAPSMSSSRSFSQKRGVSSPGASGNKRALTQTDAYSSSKTGSTSKKRKKSENGQATLGAFFATSGAKGKASGSSLSTQAEVIEVDDDSIDVNSTLDPTPPIDYTSALEDASDQIEADYRLACELSASQQSAIENSTQAPSVNSNRKSAWSTLFAPREPPKCTVHGEPAKMYTVNKQGPNKGRTFYLCSRPVGPGYDKGKSERLRDEVDHRYRCNYFKWSSDLKRDNSASRG